MTRAVVIAGMGVNCSAGATLAAFRSSLREGRHGLSPLEGIPVSRSNATASQIKSVSPTLPGRLRRIARTAISEALAHAGIAAGGDEARRMGLYFATVSGDGHTAERLFGEVPEPAEMTRRRRLALATFPSGTLADRLARDFGLEGPRQVNSNACASGLIALAAATYAIRTGRIDAAVVCGADQLKPITYWGADRSGIIGPTVRPFHRLRNGTVFGDGAGAVVIEAAEHALARGARPLAEIAGVALGCSDDPHEIIPQLEGSGIARCIAAALAEAGLAPQDIGYINCHASGTVNIDISEYAAIRKAFGAAADDIPVSATKSFTGHLSSASAIIELVVAIDAVATGYLPETLGLDDPDPKLPLRHVPKGGLQALPRPALSLSMGGGGVNTAAVLKPLPEAGAPPLGAATPPCATPAAPPRLVAALTLSGAAPRSLGSRTGAGLHWLPLADLDTLSGGEANAHYNRAARLALAATTGLVARTGLSEEELRSERLALVVATALGGTATWSDLLARTYAINPRHITPSMALSHGAHLGATLTARAFGIVGPTVTLTCGETSGLAALALVCDMMALGLIDRALVCGVDIADEPTCRAHRLLGMPDLAPRDAATAMLIEAPGIGSNRPALGRLAAVAETSRAVGAGRPGETAAQASLAAARACTSVDLSRCRIVEAAASGGDGPLAALAAALAETLSECGDAPEEGAAPPATLALVAAGRGGGGATAILQHGGWT